MDRPSVFRGVKDDGYDPKKVYTRATNSFNHSRQIRVAYPPEILAAMQQLVNRNPHMNNIQDYERNAVHHQMQRDADDQSDFDTQAVLARERLHIITDQRRARFAAQRDTVEDLRNHFDDLERERMYDEMRSLIDEIQMSDYDLDPSWQVKLDIVIERAERRIEGATRRADG